MAEPDFTTELVEGGHLQPGDVKIVHYADITYWGDSGHHTILAGPDGIVDHIVTVKTGPSGRLLTILNTVTERDQKGSTGQSVNAHIKQVVGLLVRIK
jgi:hypothetical protein